MAGDGASARRPAHGEAIVGQPARIDPSPACARAIAFALIGGLLLCWPVLFMDGPLQFPDSRSYLLQGQTIADWVWRSLSNLVAAVGAPDGSAGSGPIAAVDGGVAVGEDFAALAGRADALRSVTYAIFAHVATASPLGDLGLLWAQGAITLLAFWPLAVLVWEEAPWLAAAAGAVGLVATSLPWFTIYMMPDVFGALPVLFALALVSGVERIDRAGRLLLVLLATFGILTHYGNIPLAAAAAATALGLRALRGRCTGDIALLGMAPLVLALSINLALSHIVSTAGGGGPSITPLRLPLLLARSIDDGPARWHLERECLRGTYAVCEAFPDGVPDNVRDVMWSEGGLNHAGRPLLDRIRAEEPLLLWRAFLEHPGAQLRALASNTALQTVRAGLGQLRPPNDDPEATGVRDSAETAQRVVYLSSLALLAFVLLRGRRSGTLVDLAVVLAVALLANAFVFGALSAPTERYQSRIAWLAPVIALWLWGMLRRRAERAP